MLDRNQIKTGLDRRERLIAIVGAVSLLLVVVLSKFVTIGSAVIAPGQVVVQGKPRPVQSLDAGIVREILVRDGSE